MHCRSDFYTKMCASGNRRGHFFVWVKNRAHTRWPHDKGPLHFSEVCVWQDQTHRYLVLKTSYTRSPGNYSSRDSTNDKYKPNWYVELWAGKAVIGPAAIDIICVAIFLMLWCCWWHSPREHIHIYIYTYIYVYTQPHTHDKCHHQEARHKDWMWIRSSCKQYRKPD